LFLTFFSSTSVFVCALIHYRLFNQMATINEDATNGADNDDDEIVKV
jgi:hypothetical protein